uniref:Uncharacterized protein n=1 Tax=Oryza rufipogon TaxID=4529 RepID=A0A0E0N9T7_ORYRU
MDHTILGAWNLSSTIQQPQPPVASLQLKGFSVESHSDDRRRELEVYTSQVVHLGGGKLCVAKMFSVNRRERGKINFAMLTGVEVVRCRGGKLRIVKHKSSAWSKAGDWELPFRGRAEHVPEHGLWFGISDMDGTILGAWNLSSAFQQPQPPVASLQVKGFSVESHSDDRRRRELEVYASQVVHLGGGKLCVAKMFSVDRRERGEINFAMLTGVEVVRGRGGKLRVVKHKSRRYNFGQDYTPVYLL